MQESGDRQLNRNRKQCMNKMRNFIKKKQNTNHKRPNKNSGAKGIQWQNLKIQHRTSTTDLIM